ncbi:MAG: phosphatidylserine decarboxylase family protein [Bacteroidetes bacterium HGW-Bacteroidetes-4]|jgi:phosphatidylserine decarboxylase|nr:MAG: phosphatidylserine decarboxylase family protein [Bacteroidetes bacterium HGW-Bacteroidetes-4]
MKIHKAGYSIILVAFLLFSSLIALLVYTNARAIVFYPLLTFFILLFAFVIRFFRKPKRNIQFNEKEVFAPADGTIVTIEEVEETEFIKEKCIQVSIFMSVWNVHINWFPVIGKIIQLLHFDGRYMAAWLPKSSHENERSVVVIETVNSGKILVKQIAGALARRIITYAKPNDACQAGQELGFIRFGSRVDILLPLGSTIHVNLDQKVTGGLTKIADLPK